MESNDENDDQHFEAAMAAFLALTDLSAAQRVNVTTALWLMLAANERNEALPIPGGYPEVQKRQLQLLERMTEMVRTDTPDLEGERLFLEGDYTGMMDHYRQRIADAGKDDQSKT